MTDNGLKLFRHIGAAPSPMAAPMHLSNVQGTGSAPTWRGVVRASLLMLGCVAAFCGAYSLMAQHGMADGASWLVTHNGDTARMLLMSGTVTIAAAGRAVDDMANAIGAIRWVRLNDATHLKVGSHWLTYRKVAPNSLALPDLR